MATDTGDSKKSYSFAPRAPQIEAERRPVRASILFIALGLGLTVVTVLWLGFFTQPGEIKLEVTDFKIDESGDVELTGAIYQGRTQHGEPYEVTAEVASERASGIVDLSDPTAQLSSKNGDLIDLKSRNGVYYPDISKIDLAGDVVVNSRDLGVRLLAFSLSADLADGSMVSNEPVRMERSDGVVTANGMEVTDQGKRIIFKGDARLTLNGETGDR